MKERSILIQEQDLARYLRENWRGFDTKDYELLAALLLSRLHREKLGDVFNIGLPVLLEAEQEIPNEYSYENIELILKKYIKEDTPIDIFLVSEREMGEWPTDPNRRQKAKGQGFQIKKVGSRESGDITNSILDFLAKISRHYAPVAATLVLVIGGGQTKGTVNLRELKKNFKSENFPFKTVLYMSGTKQHIVFGELYPNFGWDKYPLEDFFYV